MPHWATVEHRALADGLVAYLALNVCQELPPEEASARSLLQHEHQVPAHFLPPPEPLVWRPQAAPGSQLAGLSCTADVLLDLSGPGVTGLRRLSLSNCSIVCPGEPLRAAAPAACCCHRRGTGPCGAWRLAPPHTERTGSCVEACPARPRAPPPPHPPGPQAFAALSEPPCSEAGWRALASLPKLQSC
jgi:hypothetical protein